MEYDPKRVEPISGQHTLAGYRQSYLWRLSLAVWDTSPQSMEREFGVRIKPAESFYGSLAKTFLEMPTTLRQMLRRTFWRLRILPQVSRRLPWHLRVLPQVLRRLLWRLRESRKSRGVCLGVCGYSRKSRGVCLGVCGYSRKSRGKCQGVCGSPARALSSILALTRLLQAFPKALWPLQHAIRDIIYE